MIDFKLISLTHGSIDLKPEAPGDFSPFLVLDSSVNYAEGNYGRLVLQEVEANPFHVLYNIYVIRQRFLLHFNRDAPLLLLHVLLKNNLRYQVSDMGYFDLKEGQFNIFYLPRVDGTCFFEGGGEYRTFNVFLPVSMLEHYATLFPFVQEFIDQITEKNTASLLRQHGWINSNITHIINQILQCEYPEPIRKVYFNTVLKELLLLLLQQQYDNIHQVRQVHSLKQSLYAIKNTIERNTNEHFTIGQLARGEGLTELKLKNGFKEFFGITIFQFLLQARMQKAWLLVLQTDKPVKEIARLTGYTTKQNFVTAFKKYFNATPGSLRKR